MRSPEDMKIIEIDVTNACIHRCSNCTRMCGHHKKPYFMSFETFKRAVDSMEGFEGGVSMMGGEPTLHPEFERFAEYLNSKYNDLPQKKNYFITPTRNFIRDRKLEERNLTYSYSEMTGTNGIGQRIKGPVLFSSLASNYFKYYEIIQDVFRYQGVNDHMIPCYHQPIGVTRKDMGIPDEEWYPLRDRCWVQNTWSASITPKGCFFCEVAGALDMLFNGPGGWPIEKGWWKRRPEDFKDQLHWCELCGVALNTRSRNANEMIDDISQSFYNKLKDVDSPKLKAGHIHLYSKNEPLVLDGENRKADYHNTNLDRIGKMNSTIYPKGFHGILFCDSDTLEDIEFCIKNNLSELDDLTIFVPETRIDEFKSRLSKQNNVFIKRNTTIGGNLALQHYLSGQYDYYIYLTVGIRLTPGFSENLKHYAINPGTMHVVWGKELSSLDSKILSATKADDVCCLYNINAKALRNSGFDGVAACRSIKDFIDLWSKDKIVKLGYKIFEDRIPEHEIDIKPNVRYVVFGCGTYGEKAYRSIISAGSQIAFYVDSNPEKQGDCLMHGKNVLPPEVLSSRRAEFDKVVIASISYQDIKKIIQKNGIPDEDIVAPIF